MSASRGGRLAMLLSVRLGDQPADAALKKALLDG